MGPEWLDAVLAWVAENPAIAGVTIALVTFLEGLAVVGIFIPGIVILFGFGALVGLGVLELGTLWFWASAGAIVGDGVSFWIGHHYRYSLRDMWPFSRFEELIDRGVTFFRRHGLKSIIIGRFVGPVRPIMPVVAGMMSMPLKRYIPANILAGIAWAPAYFLPGVVFGASIELAKAVALRLALLLALLALLVWVLYWLVGQTYGFLAPRTSQMLTSVMLWSQRHPLLGRPARALVDPSRPESGTLLMFAAFTMAATWGLATVLVTLAVAGAPTGLDRSILEALIELRSPGADLLMASLLGLGDDSVLFPAATVLLAWLMLRQRRMAAVHWGIAIAFGWLLAVLFGRLMEAAGSPLSSGQELVFTPVNLAFPVAVYGFFAILTGRELPGRRRMWPYAVATVVVSLVGFSHAYFGLAWSTHLLAGASLGVLWIAILGLAYRTRSRRSFWMAPAAALFFVSLAGSATFFVARYAEPVARGLAPTLEREVVASDAWWKGRWSPTHQAPFPLNVQYAGRLEDLASGLRADGWDDPPLASWGMVFQMLQPHPGPESLPILPAAFRGRGEVLIMHRSDVGAEKEQAVVRFWPAGLALDDGTEVWVGSVSAYQVKRVAWFFSYWSQSDRVDATDWLLGLTDAGFEVHRETPWPRDLMFIRRSSGRRVGQG